MTTDLDALLAANPREPESATAAPRRHRHQYAPVWLREGDAERVIDHACRFCGRPQDVVLTRRGRTSRNRGNAWEREVAAKLGARRVGQYGAADDVRGDWISVQCKVGGAYPERIDRWLRALPADAGQLRAVVIGDAPGGGHRRRALIVLDLADFIAWFGRGSQGAA